MGYMKHSSVIVTNWDEVKLKEAHAKAIEIYTNGEFVFGNGASLISSIVYGIVNSQASFFIAPDGSKEGWGDSNRSDELRSEFLDWIISSHNLSHYIEVRFGGDNDGGSYIVRTLQTDLDKL